MAVEYCPPFDFSPEFMFWVGTVLGCVVCLLGLIGNSLVLMVYTRRKHQFTAEGILLPCLGFADILQLTCGFLIVGLRYVYPYNGDMREYFEVTSLFMIVILQPLWYMAQCFSAYIILFLCYCRWSIAASRGQETVREDRVWKVVTIIFLFSFFFAVPRYAEATVQLTPLSPECAQFRGQMRWTLMFRAWASNEAYVLWYQKILFNTIVYVLPALGIVVLSCLTALHLGSMSIWREAEGAKKDQLQLTVMIFATGMVWIILSAPITVFWYLGTAHFNPYHYEVAATMCILVLCSCNLVMYYIIGEDFRRELWLSLRTLRVNSVANKPTRQTKAPSRFSIESRRSQMQNTVS